MHKLRKVALILLPLSLMWFSIAPQSRAVSNCSATNSSGGGCMTDCDEGYKGYCTSSTLGGASCTCVKIEQGVATTPGVSGFGTLSTSLNVEVYDMGCENPPCDGALMATVEVPVTVGETAAEFAAGVKDLLESEIPSNCFVEAVTTPEGDPAFQIICFDFQAKVRICQAGAGTGAGACADSLAPGTGTNPDGGIDIAGFHLQTQEALPGVADAPFSSILNGDQEVPPVVTPATGSGVFALHSGRTFSYNIAFEGLLGAETAAHIHGPAPIGENAGVIFTLPLGSPKIGTVGPLTPAQEDDLLAGLWYVNIHSAMFPAGEIRGQIIRTTTGVDGGVSTPDLGRLALAVAHNPLPRGGRSILSFSLQHPDLVSLLVYDVMGGYVATLVDRRLEPGDHSIAWRGRNQSGNPVPAGVYLARLSTRGAATARKIIVIE